ncbi:hypothetical protein [uncultured Aquimarina sp.]|uniref:hypothetical protein n=1 Tax=uncultured Aquimarina sp. TaxID=575652 RepID=UPI00261952E4|nr:hypothetical protein [uncultured Aquimarina sp.]
MTLEEANTYIDTNFKKLFDDYQNLNLLASMFDPDENSYFIGSNIGRFPKNEYERTKENIDLKENVAGEVLIKSIPGGSFSPFLGNSDHLDTEKPNLEDISSGMLIRNTYRSVFGTLGLIFKIKGRDKNYLLTNNHVIGRTIMLEDQDEAIIKCSNDKKIGAYKNGVINNYIDAAYAEITVKTAFEEQKREPLSPISQEVTLNMTSVNNNLIKIMSSNAYVKVEDKYFYKEPKILRNQILIDKNMISGRSGTISLSENKSKIIGLLCAVNDNYSILNNIHHVFDFIAKKEKITKEDISIINQF